MKYTQHRLYPGDNYSGYEQLTVDLLATIIKDDWVVFDCGAKTGYYTLLFSEICQNGVVHSFEPTSTFDMLIENVKLNNISNVITNRLALGESTGLIEDNIYRIWGQSPERETYDFITIDDYCIKNNITKLDFIKIDVDSYDFEVLKGSINTLKNLKPIVTVELNYALNIRNSSVEEVVNWMIDNDYVLCHVTNDENHTFKHKTKV